MLCTCIIMSYYLTDFDWNGAFYSPLFHFTFTFTKFGSEYGHAVIISGRLIIAVYTGI